MFELIGLFIPTFLISRFFIYILKKIHLRQSLYILSNALSWIASSFLYTLGRIEGGEQFFYFFVISGIAILLPQIIWLIVDTLKDKGNILNAKVRKITLIIASVILSIVIAIFIYGIYASIQ